MEHAHPVWDLPLVGSGRCFLLHRKRVIAFDERTHKRLWSGKNEKYPKALWEGRLVAWADSNRAVLLDQETGQQQRAIECAATLEVAVVGNTLVGQAPGDLVYAVDLTDGSVRWQWNCPKGQRITCLFAASPEGVFLGLEDGTVLALRLADGRQIWEKSVAPLTWVHPTDGVTAGNAVGTAAVYRDLVIFRVDANYVVALSVKNGQVIWQKEIPARIAETCLYGDRHYVTTWGNEYRILDAASGKTQLTANLKKSLPSKLLGVINFFPLLVSESHIFTGCNDGYILAFERDTGKYVWSHRPKGAGSFQAQTYFMSVNNRFYYADMSFRLYCLEEEKPSPATRNARGPARKGAEEDEAEPRRLAFEITAIHERQELTRTAPYHERSRRGEYTVLECRAQGAPGAAVCFATQIGEDGTGEGRLWAPSVEAGNALVETAKQAFPARLEERRPGRRVRPPRRFGVMILDKDETEREWMAAKWTSEEGEVEFFLKLRTDGGKGLCEIVEKDEAYRGDLLEAIAGLLARS